MLLCIAEVEKGGERIGGFRKKLKIPESEISQCAEYKIKLKTGKIFVNQKILKKYYVKIYEIGSYFYEHYEEKIRLIKMDVTTYYLELMKINWMKKDTLSEILFLKINTRSSRKKLNCKFIRINTSKEN